MADNQVVLHQKSLIPTPLSVYSACVNVSGGVTRTTLHTAQQVTNHAFETAKTTTKVGYKLAKNLSFRMVHPVIDFAQYCTLLGITIGQTLSNTSFHTTTEFVRHLQHFFGDKESLTMIKGFMDLLLPELKKTGNEMSVYDAWRMFTCWVSMQKVTRLQWQRKFVFPAAQEIEPQPLPDPRKQQKVWKSLIKKKATPKPVANFPTNPAQLLIEARHFIRFANGVYGERVIYALYGKLPLRNFNDDREFYADYCGIDIADCVFMSKLDTPTDLFDTRYKPTYCISVDHFTRSVVVAFRGTVSAKDIVVDLSGDLTPFQLPNDPMVYAIHGGMYQIIKTASAPNSHLYNTTKQLLEDYPDYSLVLTGHSLGAGFASILGVVWADPFTCRTRPEMGFGSHQVRVFAFACPSIMNDELGSIFKDLILTIIIGWDWLVRVSMNSILEIRDVMVQLKKLEHTDPHLIKALLNGTESATCTYSDQFLALREQFTQQTTDHGKIHPPGRIAWIYKSRSTDQYVMYDITDRSKVFGEILFEENVQQDHLPPAYDEILSIMTQY
jgi:hypothetical protein